MAATTTDSISKDDDECDYLVIGGGATGLAFCDTLLSETSVSALPKIFMVDKHETAGGQWHDSYKFVRLHQPSSMYGVESLKLEKEEAAGGTLTPEQHQQKKTMAAPHRATRTEILKYYQDTVDELNFNYDFHFYGNTTFDLQQLDDSSEGSPNRCYTITNDVTGLTRTVRVRKRVVDARNLEPDLPISTPPKFKYDSTKITVQPVNAIVNDDQSSSSSSSSSTTDRYKYFVVLGGGKTGMDAVYHLLTAGGVEPQNLLWVVPNDAWITARENISNCIDLLYTSLKIYEGKGTDNSATVVKQQQLPQDLLQYGFQELERRGNIYRIDESVTPTKFKDATLSLEELKVLQSVVPRKIQKGRVREITNDGRLVFEDGTTMDLPFENSPSLSETTLFVHCSAGAFHFSKTNRSPPPIFGPNKIVVQDIYGTPGYCFVGSMLGKLESMTDLNDDERNAMARAPKPSPDKVIPPLGPSGGDVIGPINKDHVFVQRTCNLKRWLQNPILKEWIFKSRLFHFGGENPDLVSNKVDYIINTLKNHGIDLS